MPFQLAYAVSIHKAQGLEYDSVKVVITDANEERISHSIFYTAIMRARRRLAVRYSPPHPLAGTPIAVRSIPPNGPHSGAGGYYPTTGEWQYSVYDVSDPTPFDVWEHAD